MYRHVFLPGLGDTLIISTQHIPGKGVLIHLCDNGPGVKEEKLLNIGSKSLGYSIIKGLCAQLKAELTVYSNRGLNYEILLPLKKIQ
jgi:two-component sensor histidine kinase